MRLAAAGISFDLSDEQRELQALAHEFAERERLQLALFVAQVERDPGGG